MAPLHPISDPAVAMRHSPMLRAVCLTLDYVLEKGPIGLTATGALKRYFVEWAAAEFDWPFYTTEDLYAVNKVLNECDFPPLMIMHDLLLSAKTGGAQKWCPAYDTACETTQGRTRSIVVTACPAVSLRHRSHRLHAVRRSADGKLGHLSERHQMSKPSMA
ncbi:hypothetical protein ACFSTD_22245 [Novosphingobium colocasiae]